MQQSDSRRTCRHTWQPLLWTPGEKEIPRSKVKEEGGADVVQFMSPVLYADRDEGKLVVEVMRIGSFKGRCSVMFRTEDGTATDGDDYVAMSSEVLFEDGEDTQSVEIDIISKSGFETTEEFKLVVEDPINCKLGVFLYRARVKVCGKGYFPSQKYSTFLSRGRQGIDELGGWRLLFEFLRMVMHTEGLAWRVAMTILLDQIPNLYLYACLWVSVYLVDYLFDKDVKPFVRAGPHEGRIYTAYAIAAIYLVPVLVIHVADVSKAYMDVEGRISSMLKMHMIRKFLNYSEESRQQMGPARLQSMIMQRCDDLAECFLISLQLLFFLGKLVVLSIFCAMKDRRALMSSAFMPVIMCIFAAIQAPILRAHGSAANAAKLEMAKVVAEVGSFFQLVSEFQKRPVAEEMVLKSEDIRRVANNTLEITQANKDFLGQVLGPLFIAFHVALHAEDVINGVQPLGTFVTTIAVFKELSGLYSQAYTTGLKLSSSHGALKQMTECLNMPVDLARRKTQNRARREGLRLARREIIDARAKAGTLLAPGLPPASDVVPIKMTDMCYSFPKRVLFQNVNLSQSQGSIVAICGNHGSGKSTLMRILGNSLLPTSGTVFVPSHLRTVYIEQRASVLDMSAWQNLTFGDTNASPSRVLDILTDFRMHYVKEVTLHDLEKAGRSNELTPAHRAASGSMTNSDKFKYWRAELSHAEAAKVNVARALIMSPEVLIMQRPMGNFNFAERSGIMSMLKAFVKYKGYRLPQEGMSSRRPRTLFFSPTWREDLSDADTVWDIQDKTIFVRPTKDLSEADFERLFSGLTDDMREESM